MKANNKKIMYGITASLVLAVFFQLEATHFFYLRQNMVVEPWRFITAHYVHVGWIHYLLNMFAFICLPFIFPKLTENWLFIGLCTLPLFISASFYLFYPEIYAYAGFSGVLHGLYTIAILQSLKIYSERTFALLILCGLIIKLCWEAMIGSASATAKLIGSPVLIEAHQLGVFGAVILIFIEFIYRKLTK